MFRIIVLVLISVSLGHSQMRFGIKTSIGILPTGPETNFAANVNNTPADFKITYDSADPIYGIGVFVQDEIGWLYFQSDLLFTSYHTEFTVTAFNQTDDLIGKVVEEWKYLDWQVLAGIYKKNYRFGVGPVVHILVDQESNFDEFALYNEKLRRLAYGMSAAVGYNFGLFTLDIKYERSFRTIGDHIWYDEFKSTFEGPPDILSSAVGFGF